MAVSASRWRPIGAVLVENGAITENELQLALSEQRESGRRLGEILIDSGRITWLALAQAIALQAEDLDATDALVAPESLPAQDPPLNGHASSGSVEQKLETVEAMLKDRQRAFLELVSTTETLRQKVAKLQDEVLVKNTEIAALKERVLGG